MSSQITLNHTLVEQSELRRGWPIILACFFVATFGWGFGFYGQAVYLADLQQRLGWPASLIASATTVYYLAGAVLLSQVHRAMRLVGPRLLLMTCAIVLGVGVIGVSRVTQPWQLYLCGLVMAVGWAGTSTTAIATTLARWFDQRRGFAISLALNGASAGGFTIAPLLVQVGHRVGLAEAVPIVVCGALLLVLPVVLVGIRRGEPDGATILTHAPQGTRRSDPDGLPVFTSEAALLRSWRLWSIALPFALALAAQVGFIVHQVAFLLPHLGNSGTGFAIASTAIAATAGRLTVATVVDRLNQRVASAVCFASQAVGLGLMLAVPEQPIALYVGSVVFGFSVGNVVTLPSLIVQREFAAVSFGLVIGLSSMIGQATLAFGPTLLGLAHDFTGGYGAAIGLCMMLQLIGAVIVLRSPVTPGGG